ncbi:hypothetical protein Pst134EA_032727, partial [Puccinia striiformis f. sp. tritici]|uniref:uncharacterized protein n=1 Tax=Puccinia striiformis f. sp. tritici TaxID=168172 RepID=UPI0020081845
VFEDHSTDGTHPLGATLSGEDSHYIDCMIWSDIWFWRIAYIDCIPFPQPDTNLSTIDLASRTI